MSIFDLFKAKIGWNGTSNVNNLTALQSAKQEQRAQIDVRLMYEVSNISEINNILSASLIIENEKSQILYEDTFFEFMPLGFDGMMTSDGKQFYTEAVS